MLSLSLDCSVTRESELFGSLPMHADVLMSTSVQRILCGLRKIGEHNPTPSLNTNCRHHQRLDFPCAMLRSTIEPRIQHIHIWM